MFGKPAVGGELAAEDRKDRRFSLGAIDLKRVVAGQGGKSLVAAAANFEQRPHSRVAPHDLLAGDGLAQKGIDLVEHVRDLTF